MGLFNLKLPVPQLYQVIVQAPTLKELDGLVTLFQHLALIAQQLMSSFKQRWNNSAHNHSGLFVKDAAPIHEVEKNPLQPSPDDKHAEAITY